VCLPVVKFLPNAHRPCQCHWQLGWPTNCAPFCKCRYLELTGNVHLEEISAIAGIPRLQYVYSLEIYVVEAQAGERRGWSRCAELKRAVMSCLPLQKAVAWYAGASKGSLLDWRPHKHRVSVLLGRSSLDGSAHIIQVRATFHRHGAMMMAVHHDASPHVAPLRAAPWTCLTIA